MNNPHEEKIQDLLRRAPRPQPPRSLKERLIMNARSGSRNREAVSLSLSQSWFRRWWPVLVPAGLSLVCVVVLAVQQREIRELRKSISVLSQSRTNQPANVTVKPQTKAFEAAPADHSAEIAQLKDTARKLTAEIAELEQAQLENQKLRAQLAAPPPGMFSPQETQALAEAREKSERISCVNNLKQIGLAARIWAGDNTNLYPTDIVCMSNELSTTKILVCPGDHGRQTATNFPSFTMANCSYEFFLSPQGSDAEPTRVLTRCPIHGTIGLYDGSVQMGVAKDHPEWLIQRDGKLYFERPANANP